MCNKLALFGGHKLITKRFKRYNSIGIKEISAANKVLRTGILSDFIAGKNKNFLGGIKVNQFERQCEKYFKVKHAVTVNSWTSGLICAVGAIDIEPGDEVIVTPWTMPATATAILHWNAIPVFADIDKNTFNLNIESIEANISKYTKAIIAVDIFGQSADIYSIMKIKGIENDESAAKLLTFNDKIELKNIQFSYNNNKKIMTTNQALMN